MNDLVNILHSDQVNSIVLGAAENAARSRGLTISSPALDRLLNEALRALNEANERGELVRRQQEVEANTTALIQKIIEENMSKGSGEITLAHVNRVLSGFCERFPDFFPFCP